MTDVLRRPEQAFEMMQSAPISVSASADAAARHVDQFYDAPEFLLDRLRDYVRAGLRCGEVTVVIATEAHRAGLEERLIGAGIDVKRAQDDGQFISLDAADLLAQIMVDGAPDPDRFQHAVRGILTDAQGRGCPVRVFGEMVALLAAAEDYRAAVQLERLWNTVHQPHPFSLLCAYPMEVFDGRALAGSLDAICAEHQDVVPTEGYAALPDPESRFREITWLQQKARSLEAEVAEHQRTENALQSLLRISQKLHACLDLESLLDHLVKESLQLVGAEGGCAGLRTADSMVCQKYITRTGSVPLASCWTAGHGLPGWVLEHKAAYVTNDALADTQIVRELCFQFGVWAALCMPILDSQGDVLGFLELHNKTDGSRFTLTDQERLTAVSQIASVAIQNARLFRETQDAIRLRNELLSVTSHELRTPLTAVLAHAQLMLRRISRDATVDMVTVERTFRVISHQAGKLTRLIDQCLDVTRLETGRISLDLQPTDLRGLVERIAGEAAVRTRQLVQIFAPEPICVTADPLRMDQLLTNLVDNAIRFGSDTAPIEISLLPDADGGAVLAVRDYGDGISPEKRFGLFERFFQAHADGHKSGMGLGLYICRQIVELHGGEIRAEFPADGGTRFVVRLPAAPDAAGPA